MGDITHIYTTDGTLVARYVYDAWGNHKILDSNGTEITSNTNVGVINPIRYRGYYYDDETGLYYLEARYYDPETGRFISQDSIDFIVPNHLTGLNLYAYCGNNPVMRTDSAGTSWSSFWKSAGNFFINAGKVVGGGLIALVGAATTISSLPISLTMPGGGFATQVSVSTTLYGAFMVGSVFSSEINRDMQAIGWNPFNSNADTSANATKVSFYKGVPVFKIDGLGGSFSFGIIGLDVNHDADVLRHERGHNTQLMTMGVLKYGIFVGIPSPIKNADNSPWELSATILGNSNLGSNIVTAEDKKIAMIYYISACTNIMPLWLYNLYYMIAF